MEDTTFKPLVKPEMFQGTDDIEELMWYVGNSLIVIIYDSLPNTKTVIGWVIMIFVLYQCLRCYAKAFGKRKHKSKSKH